MKKLLWIGDAACGSGFGRASHYILKYLTRYWNVHVLGTNYTGDPHDEPYPIYPAWPGGDMLGVRRLRALIESVKPDLIVAQTNPWHFPHYKKHIPESIPYVGICAVEGKNCQGHKLNGLTRAIFWNEFSRNEAVQGGYKGPSDVVPLGVDLDVYVPGDKLEARMVLGLPERTFDAFIITNINRNQHRKRLDLSVRYFAKWVREYGIEDAYLCFHALQGSTVECDIEQLAWYYGRDERHPNGVQDRLIMYGTDDPFKGFPEEHVKMVYQSSDVYLSTSLGEGWGLTAMEAMAMGLPVVAGDYSAFGEWAKDAAVLVPCPVEGVMPDVHVMIGGIPDERATIEALNRLYNDPAWRDDRSRAGRQLAHDPRYRWDNISEGFARSLEQAYADWSQSGHQGLLGEGAPGAEGDGGRGSEGVVPGDPGGSDRGEEANAR